MHLISVSFFSSKCSRHSSTRCIATCVINIGHAIDQSCTCAEIYIFVVVWQRIFAMVTISRHAHVRFRPKIHPLQNGERFRSLMFLRARAQTGQTQGLKWGGSEVHSPSSVMTRPPLLESLLQLHAKCSAYLPCLCNWQPHVQGWKWGTRSIGMDLSLSSFPFHLFLPFLSFPSSSFSNSSSVPLSPTN